MNARAPVGRAQVEQKGLVINTCSRLPLRRARGSRGRAPAGYFVLAYLEQTFAWRGPGPVASDGLRPLGRLPPETSLPVLPIIAIQLGRIESIKFRGMVARAPAVATAIPIIHGAGRVPGGSTVIIDDGAGRVTSTHARIAVGFCYVAKGGRPCVVVASTPGAAIGRRRRRRV